MTGATRAPILPPLTSYEASRGAFLADVEERGARIDSYPIAGIGPDGETLHTDVARFGPPPGESRSVVVVASGTHGVEGHAGSGVQRLLAASGQCDSPPPGVALVLVHAVNPFGMAWSRRVDQDNIDVNRNFVDFTRPLPRNEHYERISPILNPQELDLDDRGWLADLAQFAEEVGLTAAFRAVSGGQYEIAHGMQYGGRGPSASAEVQRAIWREHLGGAQCVVNLDIHTGLGPSGRLTVFQTADEAEPSAQCGARLFPDVVRSDRTGGRDPLNYGILGPGMDACLADVELVVPLVLEFGTLAEMDVLAAMRADNWLHHHADPTGPIGEEIRRRSRETFFVDDECWRRSVAESALEAVDAAIEVAADR